MGVEREISKDQRKALVGKILSNPANLEAFLAFGQVKRAQLAHSEAIVRLMDECNLVGDGNAQDQSELKIAAEREKAAKKRLVKLWDTVGHQRTVDKNFNKGYLAIGDDIGQMAGVEAGKEDSASTGKVVAVLDELRQDWRLPLVELARAIKRDPKKQEAFHFYAKYRGWQLAQDYYTIFTEEARDQSDRFRKELTNRNKDLPGYNIRLEEEVHMITELSGAQGPFAEQYIIESIENILDPELKKQRDVKAGKAPSRNN